MLFGWRRRKTGCDGVKSLLSAYIDDQVSAQERAQVEAHLQNCSSCSTELASLRTTVDLLCELPDLPLPRSFTIAMPEAAQRTKEVSRQRMPMPAFQYLRNATAAAAAAFIILLSSGFVLQMSPTDYTASVSPSPSSVQILAGDANEAFAIPADAPQPDSRKLAQDREQAAQSEDAQPVPESPAAPMAVMSTPDATELGAGGASEPSSQGAIEPAPPAPSPPVPASSTSIDEPFADGTAVAISAPEPALVGDVGHQSAPAQPPVSSDGNRGVGVDSSEPVTAPVPGMGPDTPVSSAADPGVAAQRTGSVPDFQSQTGESVEVAVQTSYGLPGINQWLAIAQIVVGLLVVVLASLTGMAWVKSRRSVP